MTQASPGPRRELAESTAESYETRIRHRLRLLASCLLLGAIAFNTSTEKIIPETKLDMAVNPLGFLGRALHLWDGAYFGHLQNQAYGYLFPMGPFYAFGLKLGMEPWTVQRLWMSLVLCTAFLGVVQLARALGIGGPHTRVIAGFVYALAPHAQALIGINSSEFLPSAVLPWIVLPLVKGARRELSPRRAAALSAFAFLFCGGVNAVAEAAVLVVPLLYLLTRRGGAGKWRLIAWWLPLIALASMWWAAPLLTLGGYIFSFLPFIETASATTGVTSLVNALRGTSSWLSFLTVDGQTWLPDAHQQSTVPWLIVVTAAVAALGLAGLTVRRLPERPFLLISLLFGVAVITTGHPGTPHHEIMVELLDGPLAVFRNLHKFDALIRLPVALGVAGLLSLARLRWRKPLTAAAAGLMVASSLPILYAGLAPPGGFTAIPDYWKQAISWLNRNAGDGMVLAVPGAKRGEYLWGRPLDEPLQALSQARWATHTIVPWGSAGISRLMAAIDERLSTGSGSAGLTATLRRMGVTYLVVRNDLDRATIGTGWPIRVHQALEDSPGISLAAQMGPGVGIGQYGKAAAWLDQPYHAVEIYQVSGAAPLVGTVDATRPLRVGGAPEAVLDLAEQGLLEDDRPVLLNDDPGQVQVPAQDTVLTDTLRRRELSYPDLRRNASATLADGEPFRGDSPSNDILDPGWEKYISTAAFTGIAKVTASSSEADVTASPHAREPGHQPFAALDGDRRTSWRSTGWNGAVGEWLEVAFTESRTVPTIQVAFENSPIGPPPSEVVVETDTGALRQRVRATADPQELVVPKGPITRLRLKVAATSEESRLGSRVGITELTIPGVRAGRSITVPDPGSDSAEPAAIAVGRTGDVSGCVKGSVAWSCAKGHEVLGDDGNGFDRSFIVRKDGSYGVSGRAVLTERTAIERLSTLPGDPVKVQASSTAVEHGAAAGRWAFDGDPKTAWFADPLDPRPTLSVELSRATRLSQLRVVTPDSYLGAPPIRVTIRAEGGVRQSWVGKDGLIRFPGMAARKIKLEFGASGGRPIEISDIAFPGVRPLGALNGFPLRSPCGFGPTLTVDGDAVHTEIIDGTLNDVVTGKPVTFRSCEPLRLAAGPSRLAVRPGEAYRVESAIIRPEPAGRQAAPVEMREALVESWDAGERVVKVSVTDDSYLVVNENFNSGWRARLGVAELKPVRLDGWRQAWFLPSYTAGTVTLTYEPDAPYRAGLAAGGGLALLVVVLALVRAGPPARHLAPIRPARLRAAHVLPFAVALGFWVGGVAGAAVVGAVFVLGAWLRPLREAEHVRAGRRGRLLLGPPAGLALYLAAAVLVAVGVGGLWAQLLCLPLLAQLLAEVPARRVPARPAEIPVPVAAGGPTMTSVP